MINWMQVKFWAYRMHLSDVSFHYRLSTGCDIVSKGGIKNERLYMVIQ